MRRSIKRQRGMGLLTLLIGGGLLFFVAVLGMKVAPDVMGYFTLLKTVKATAHDPGLAGASVAEIRNAFGKRTVTETGKSAISAEDLEITKEGNEIVISFAYPKKIPLFANVSLVIDFEGSSK